MKKNYVICMKWGTLYGPAYVNILHAMVKRNLSIDYTFVCFTDDRTGIDPEIECRDIPEIPLGSAHPLSGWRKLASLSPKLGLDGTILFLDLDLIVTGPIDDLFTFKPGDFCIIENWSQRNQMVGNSSVYRYESDAHHAIFDHFSQNVENVYKNYCSEQEYLTRKVAETQTVQFWPDTWVRSFKRHSLPNRLIQRFVAPKLPEGCKILVFHGPPKPLEAAVGYWDNKGRMKRARPAPWVMNYWRK